MRGLKPEAAGVPRKDNSTRAASILKAKRVVVVGAHPDDLEWWAGATTYRLSRHGAAVRLILATRGDKGLPLMGWLRERAQMSSARRLGADVVFLPFRDRGLSANAEALKAALAESLEAFKPDLVICWDPDYITNAHPDHVALARACAAVSGQWRRLFYGTHKPNVWLPYTDAERQVKWAALAAHRTEYPPPLWQRTRAYQKARFEESGRQIGAPNAEPMRLATRRVSASMP